MTDTIDKLVFALGGDLTALNKAYADAEAGAQKTGTNIKNNLGTGFKDAAAAASQHADTLKKAMGEVEGATKSAHGAASTATREFRALFDEISSGRTRQSPGTIAIIATRVFGISTAALAASVAIAAIPVAFAVAAYQAETALTRVDEALKRTGNQAGVTMDQIRTIAGSGIPGLSEGSALGVLGTLAGRGNIAPGLLGSVARATPGFARATDTTTDKAAAELEKLLSDPAKGAAQLNEEFKLLDVSTTRQIEDLQASGRTAEAQAILVKGLNDRFDGLAKSSWSLSSAFSGLGEKLSNFWFKTGAALSGSGETDIAKYNRLKSELDAATKAYQAGGGVGGGAGGGSGINASIAAMQTLPKQISELAAKIAHDSMDAAGKREAANQNSAVGYGLKIADAYDEQAQKSKKLQEQLSGLNIAVDNAIGKNAKYREELVRERDAVQTALQHQMTPAQIAAQAASDQRRIAAAAPGHARDTLTAQIAAQREYQRNLSNPSTAPYAKSILDSQLSTAGLINKEGESATKAAAKKAEEEAARMKKNLDAAIALADGEEKLAAAYDESTQAVVRAKAQGEAHTALVKKEISDEDAYAAALLRRAFATEQASVSQKHLEEQQNIAGLGRVAAAGGNPAAVSKANEQNTALASTAKEFAAATTMTETLRAQADYRRALSDEEQKDAANRLISSNQTDTALQNSNDMLKLQLSLKYEDADLRAKEIAQLETIQELQTAGYEKGTAEYEAEYRRRVALKQTAAALGGDGGSAGQIYSAFRDGLGGVLMAGTNGFKSMGDAASNFLKQLAQMTLQLYIFTPLLNILLGKSGSSGGGFLGSLFSSVTSGIGSLFGGGKAIGGNVDPGKFYVVGENGPEILGGIGGHVTPLSGPRGGSGGGGGAASPTEMHFSMTVVGDGDKDILAKAEAASAAMVQKGIQANNKVAKRTMRGNLIQQNKRSLN